jgi:transglutaminase-like putative cysteine protease
MALRIDRIEAIVRIAPDATSTRTHRLDITALSREGTAEAGRRQIQFNRDLESIEILEAYTLKTDGTRIAVGADGITTQVGLVLPASGQGLPGISMPGIEVRQLTFPDLGPGDRSVLAWQVRRHRPELPGFARFVAFLAPNLEIRDARYRIEAPASLELAVEVEGMRWTRQRVEETDVWEIEGASDGTWTPEPGVADAWLQMPRVLASTFADAAALADAFARAFDAKAAPTETTRTLARRVVGDRSTDEEKARAVYDWIRANLRYAAVWIGVDGWVPHDVEAILRNRYGDCKDLTLLMIALLRAVDVEAVPALIDTNPVFVLPPVGIGTNHVIVYLPGLQRFADPTAADVAFGDLPQADRDKPVTVALAGGTRMLRTPAATVSSEQGTTLTVKSHWKIARNGDASATIDLSATGEAGSMVKAALLRAPAGGNAAARSILSSSRLEGRGTIDWPTRNDPSQTQRVRLEFSEIRGLLADPQAGSLPPHPLLALPVYILRNLGDQSLETRRSAMLCPPMRIREEFEIELDAAYRLRRVPEPIRVSHEDGIVFEATYTLAGNRLTGWRELTLDHGRHVCSPEQYGSRRPTMQRIARHLRSSMLVEQP